MTEKEACQEQEDVFAVTTSVMVFSKEVGIQNGKYYNR